MRMTLTAFCIYLMFCGLSFLFGMSVGFIGTAYLLDCLNMLSDSYFIPYFVGTVCGLFCAFLAFGPACALHGIYLNIRDRFFS